MADPFGDTCVASGRRGAAFESQCSTGIGDEGAFSFSEGAEGSQFLGAAGAPLDAPHRAASLPGSARSLDWQLPLPPVRFPFRDALLSFGDFAADGHEAAAQAPARPPLKVHSTQKTRAIREIGRQRRSGAIRSGLMEERPQPLPAAPAEADKPKTPPKAIPSLATNTRQARLRGAEEAGRDWPVLEESQSAPELSSAGRAGSGGGARVQIRETWTSAARTVLGHSRRFPGSLAPTGEGGQLTLEDAGSRWPGAALQSYRHLPRPVKEWAARGLEFTDAGLGIGDRFDVEIEQRAKRAPGFIYDQNTYGNVALWLPCAASQPTKQPDARHVSAEVHRMVGRWRDGPPADRQMPDPGAYEIPGFVEELQRKIARRTRGDTGRRAPAGASSRSPRASPPAKK